MASSSRPKNLTASGSGKQKARSKDHDGADDDITPLPGISRTSTLPLPKASGLRSRSVSPVKKSPTTPTATAAAAGTRVGKLKAPFYKHEEYNESNASLLSNASFLPDTPSPLLPPDLQKLRAFQRGNPNGELGDSDDDEGDDGMSELGPDASVVDRFVRVVHRNSGILLMLAAQVFASTMSVITRLLETGFDTEFHALQILFTRQVISVVLCSAYMHYTQVPHFPLGPKGVRWLLVARGVGGFFGVFGLYYSLTYLDVSDATVITFLAPSVAGFACYLILKEPFTKTEMLGGLVSLLGVILIARPTVLFSGGASPENPQDQGSTGSGGTEPSPTQEGIRLDVGEATPAQRFTAIMVALLGVLGAASAYTTIRWIGKRAHPLISVNYFSAWCVIVSFFGLLVLPGIGFKAPQTFLQWLLLLGIGVCGFCMQFLLTAAIQRERAGLVTHMVYAQMIFALIWDKVLWNRLPAWTSWIGSFLILGSGFWVALQKNRKRKITKVTKKEARSKRHVHSGDEERGLVAAKGSDDEDSEDDGSELDDDEARVLDVGREIQMKNLAR
ncbi:hypothetical protein TWF481_004784 [Arthrobotrys musiformis]|uniref:EamA domain-containing protein n=1 Tax=Arthrobotrys musiformis TaxID=47236 RepID=A0AAV9WKL3_9PEZI